MNDKIKVFDSDENKLKILGELLSNDTSRRMIKLLIEQESYTNQIAKLLDLRVSLVIHHLKKMEEIGILEISNKKIVKKGKEHRYFRTVPGMFVLLDKTQSEIKEKGILKRIFKEGIKFAAFPLIGFFVWSQLKRTVNSKDDSFDYGEILEIPFYQESTFVPMLIIIGGLIISIIFLYKKK